jgi:hypothetical protein
MGDISVPKQDGWRVERRKRAWASKHEGFPHQ